MTTAIRPSHKEFINAPTTAAAYKKYLLSDKWKGTRDTALKKANGQCAICAGHSRLVIHHTSYQNLGNEKDSDLLAVCQTCHQNIHRRLKVIYTGEASS